MKKLFLAVAWISATTMTLVSTLLVGQHLKSASTLAIIASQTTKPVLANPSYGMYAALPQVSTNIASVAAVADARPIIIRNYLLSQQAPLAEHAQTLVQVSDAYGLDYRLLTAIAMQESNGGKKIPDGSYNAWGWAIYGDNVKKFENWDQGIETVGKGLKNHYIDRGLTNPETIMAKYTPPSLEKGGAWAKGVNYFLNVLQ